MNNTVDTSHKSILKATGLFGLVQIIKIVLSIVSIKVVAVYLGVSGIGQLGLLQSVINIVAAVSSFGLQTILVREIATLKQVNQSEKLNLLHNWSLYVGVFGMLLFMIVIPFLNRYLFDGNFDYKWLLILGLQFVFLSLANFRTTYLQGIQQVNKYAKVQVFISFVVVLVSMFLYFTFGVQAIVYVLFTTSIISFIISYFFTKEINFFPQILSVIKVYSQTKELLFTGTMLSVNVIFGFVCTFLIKLYLKETSSNIQIVGFYEVASTIMITYVGLVFTAMASDFYPKLTTIAHLHHESNKLVNNQIQIALLLVTPVVIGLFVFGNWFIELFYTKDFSPVFDIFKFGLLYVIIKAITWPLGFYLLALKENKQYFRQELLADFLNISLSILLYNFFGLYGLGMAMVLNFFFYGAIVYNFLIKKHQFQFDESTVITMNSCLLLVIMCVVFANTNYLLILLLIISIFNSIYLLKSKIDFKSIFKKISSKF